MKKDTIGDNVSLVLVGGGVGTRMQSSTPKQFLLLKGKPIFIYALEIFKKSFPFSEIIIVMPSIQMEKAKDLLFKWLPSLEYKMISGGETRFHSCANGLGLVTKDIVMIHDAVRPFINIDLLHNLYFTALESCCAIPAIPMVDSIRKVDSEGRNYSIPRNDLRSIQTPQAFNTTLLKQAYSIEYKAEFTDDASVFEFANNKIILVEGLVENIKITQPLDLFWANAYLESSDDRNFC